jgi:hypothetical protein
MVSVACPISRRRGWRAAIVAVIAAVSLVPLSGCASSVSYAPVESCNNYRVVNGGTSFSVQQAARGSAITWGIYSTKYKSAHYYVKVYAGGVNIDTKNQYYEPHASVNADRALKYSGKVLEFTGYAEQGGNRLDFQVGCIIM